MANGWTWDFTSSTIGFAYPLMSTMCDDGHPELVAHEIDRASRRPEMREEPAMPAPAKRSRGSALAPGNYQNDIPMRAAGGRRSVTSTARDIGARESVAPRNPPGRKMQARARRSGTP